MRNTTDNFKKAALGSVAREACGVCHTPTGTLLVKTKGRQDGPRYTGPQNIANPEARCEFCEFLSLWLHSEGIDPTETGLRYGAAKIIDRGPKTGVDTLIAYVPFSSDEPASNELADGTPFEWAHGLVLRAEKDAGGGMKIVEILDE
tara:strand:- start:1489 stop:1929 length:441 start_codon:yes stop_codon:yes gene_type:complete